MVAHRVPLGAERQDAIADAAIHLVAIRGVRGLTHRAVDAAAGLPPGSTSYYLRTRHALLTACLARLLALDERAILRTSPEVPALEVLVAAVIGIAREHPESTIARYEAQPRGHTPTGATSAEGPARAASAFQLGSGARRRRGPESRAVVLARRRDAGRADPRSCRRPRRHAQRRGLRGVRPPVRHRTAPRLHRVLRPPGRLREARPHCARGGGATGATTICESLPRSAPKSANRRPTSAAARSFLPASRPQSAAPTGWQSSSKPGRPSPPFGRTGFTVTAFQATWSAMCHIRHTVGQTGSRLRCRLRA